MSQHLEKAIEGVYEELAKIEEKAKELKKTINTLSAMAGKSQPFGDVEVSATYGTLSLRPDQFFGKGLSTAVKEFLRLKGRACTAQEIFEALKVGGYEFPVEWKEKFMLKNLSISLGKNRVDFVPVPSSTGEGAYGLWEFYPEKKREREREKQSKEEPKTFTQTTRDPNTGKLHTSEADFEKP